MQGHASQDDRTRAMSPYGEMKKPFLVRAMWQGTIESEEFTTQSFFVDGKPIASILPSLETLSER